MWKLIDEVMWADDCRTDPDDQVRHPNGVHEFYGCFDCLEEGIVKATEERIIKLLDQKHNSTVSDTAHNQSGNCTACEVIALIKGEK
jgi:hypothetical protein